MGTSLRQRILAVYSGDVPDVVPYMLDLSHWFYHRNHLPWDLSVAYEAPERELIDCHRRLGCGFYLANLASFYSTSFSEDVAAETEKQVRKDGRPEIVWRLKTPLGEIERRRAWEESTYGWGISRWGVRTERDLAVLAYAMSRRRFDPQWRNYRAWVDEVGDVYVSAGYSAMGYLLHYWMGVEGVAYATADFPDSLRRAVDEVNANNLRLVDLVARSPAEVVILGDNFSGDVQSPAFFAKWSKPYYDEAVRRLHAAGKRVAVHIDGRLRGAIGMIRRTGADCGDAITPTPMGDLTPQACRDEAGPDFILSGGVSPNLWLPGVPVDVFKAKVTEWLELRKRSPRLIAGAGDQVPPGADEDRIHIMRDLVEEHGRY
ncbi:MAG TPA: uroporphyrinogen decarboxylase family protein [Thermoguttaceae bacterium]|nr:uroporphyrinogen decarboxylase family protein [Thermoguttaceae bacterium]